MALDRLLDLSSQKGLLGGGGKNKNTVCFGRCPAVSEQLLDWGA